MIIEGWGGDRGGEEEMRRRKRVVGEQVQTDKIPAATV